MKLTGALFIILVPVAALRACLWDTDTLAMEAKANFDVIQTAGGWFDRNPPAYYEIRLARVAKEMLAQPDRLDLYDDAGVACERLNRQDEAIKWMAKKKAQMGNAPPSDHLYRYLSNLGTFHLHRWARQSDPEKNIDDLRQAITLIEEALRVEPNAHFGRERVQLALMRSLKLALEQGSASYRGALSDFIDEPFRGNTDVVKGLCGLIQMGFGWESIDVQFCLANALLNREDAVLAAYVSHRVKELASNGAKSLYPWSDPVESSRTSHAPDEMLRYLGMDEERIRDPNVRKTTSDYFTAFRAAAEKQHESRLEYMEVAFRAGLHPDTDASFWEGWHPGKSPLPPVDSALSKIWGRDPSSRWLTLAIFLALVCLAVRVIKGFVGRSV